MVRLTLFLGFWLFLASPAVSGNIPPLIDHLFSRGKDISVISGYSRSFLPPELLERQLRNEWQHLVMNKGHLYLKVNGTGRLFEVLKEADSIRFVRVDSTFYLGDSFYAFNFSYNGRIYSYGGYGFWRNNGMVRIYDPLKHEWEVESTVGNVRNLMGSLLWLDEANGCLYAGHDWTIEDHLKDSSRRRAVTDHLYKLDMSTLKWEDLGSMGQVISHDDKRGIASPWGYIINWDYYQVDLLDVRSNVRYRISRSGHEKFKKYFMDPPAEFIYFLDSTMYFGNTSNNLFDSVTLSIADFIAVGPVYGREKTAGKWYIWVLSAFLLTASAVYLFLWKKRGKPKNGFATAVTQPGKANGDAFSEVEKSLIRYIRQRTAAGEMTAIEEINRVLGLSSKTEAIQKKNRSELINSVNEKWAVMYGKSSVLIERKRSVMDKRSYEYFISHEWLSALELE